MAFSFHNRLAPTDAAAGRGLVSILEFDIDGIDEPEMHGLTPKEIVLGESLLTPGLQTVITFHSLIYMKPGKDFDKFKGKEIKFTLKWGEGEGNEKVLKVTKNHKVYRMDNRS